MAEVFEAAFQREDCYKLKVALLNHSFPPDIGGGETHLLQLATGLVDLGHDVYVITGPTWTGVQRDNSMAKYKVIELSEFKKIEKGSGNFIYFIKQLKDALCQQDFDVIYVHNFMTAFAVSFIQNLLPGKIVFTFHSTPIPDEGKITGLFDGDWELEKEFSRNIIQSLDYDALLCPSRYYLQWALNLGAESSKTHLIYHGVDTQSFLGTRYDNWRQIHNIPEDKFLVLSPIRMINRKGIIELIHAAAELDNSFYFLVASSRYNESVRTREMATALIENLGISHRFDIRYDEFSVLQMPEVYPQADAVVLPSHVEGFGLVLLEAMASGVPVIGSDTSGINEIIRDNVNGILTPVKSPSHLAGALQQLRRRPELAQRLTAGGLATVKNQFSIDRQLRQLNKLFITLKAEKIARWRPSYPLAS